MPFGEIAHFTDIFLNAGQTSVINGHTQGVRLPCHLLKLIVLPGQTHISRNHEVYAFLVELVNKGHPR